MRKMSGSVYDRDGYKLFYDIPEERNHLFTEHLLMMGRREELKRKFAESIYEEIRLWNPMLDKLISYNKDYLSLALELISNYIVFSATLEDAFLVLFNPKEHKPTVAVNAYDLQLHSTYSKQEKMFLEYVTLQKEQKINTELARFISKKVGISAKNYGTTVMGEKLGSYFNRRSAALQRLAEYYGSEKFIKQFDKSLLGKGKLYRKNAIEELLTKVKSYNKQGILYKKVGGKLLIMAKKNAVRIFLPFNVNLYFELLFNVTQLGDSTVKNREINIVETAVREGLQRYCTKYDNWNFIRQQYYFEQN